MTDRLKDNTQYDTFSQKEKQIYWNGRISDIYRGDYDRFPLDLSTFKAEIWVEEDNFEIFIPWIVQCFIDWTWEELAIEDLFILDEKAQKKLWLWEDDNVKQSTTSALNGELHIPWVEMSTSELIENIWNLYYDSLSDFLTEVSSFVQNKSIRWNLEEAAKYISIAWDICEPFWKDHPKHSDNIKGLDISNESISQKIWELKSNELRHFMKLLWEKINRDWVADKERWRSKLSGNLFSAAKILCQN